MSFRESTEGSPKHPVAAFWCVCLAIVVALLATPTRAQPLCVEMEAESGPLTTVPVSLGNEFSLSFRHSLYGSLVEEHFRITTKGLQTFKLRYGEPRLLEFYGHESGRLDNGWWIVEGNRGEVQTLVFRFSPESLAKINFSTSTIALSEIAGPTGLVRVRIASCEK